MLPAAASKHVWFQRRTQSCTYDDSKKMVKCTESIMVLAKALFLESAGMLRFVLDGMDDG